MWFSTDEGEQVKDIRSGQQITADANSWTPPAVDLSPDLRGILSEDFAQPSSRVGRV